MPPQGATFTEFMLQSLQRPRAIHVRGKILKFGGVADRSGLIAKCLQRMHAYCKIVLHVALAEFPHYEICAKWRVFGAQMVESCYKAGLSEQDMPDDAKECLTTLARFFSLDASEVLQQFLYFAPNVTLEMKKYGVRTCNMPNVWAHVLSTHASRKSALSSLVSRFVIYTASTARVEQNFSSLKRVFGEHRLTCMQDKESRIAMLVLERPSSASTALADAIISRAQARNGANMSVWEIKSLRDAKLNDRHVLKSEGGC